MAMPTKSISPLFGSVVAASALWKKAKTSSSVFPRMQAWFA